MQQLNTERLPKQIIKLYKQGKYEELTSREKLILLETKDIIHYNIKKLIQQIKCQ